MATFVFVHGGWAGAWQWRTVATQLCHAGHNVFTPTLTGLGERAHLANPDVDLSTHIQDVVAVLECEELFDVVLVGYSYSGMVITGVAERAPERLAHLVYVDALVPGDGQAVADLLPPSLVEQMKDAARLHGDGWKIPHDTSDALRRTPHPLKTGLQPLIITNPAAKRIPRTFIYCTDEKDKDGLLSPIIHAAARARKNHEWHYYELPTGHKPMSTMPRELTDILVTIARNS